MYPGLTDVTLDGTMNICYRLPQGYFIGILYVYIHKQENTEKNTEKQKDRETEIVLTVKPNFFLNFSPVVRYDLLTGEMA